MEHSNVAKLRISSPGKPEQIVNMRSGDNVQVGRGGTNEIVLEDAAASRLHATFSASENGVVLQDNASLNGTFLNGERVSSLRDLVSGDVIDIGSTKIYIEVASSNAAEQLNGSRAMTAQLKPVSVTVLVTSIIDYDQLRKELPEEEVEAAKKGWIENVVGLIRKREGKIDKLLGSSVVALWVGHDAKGQADAAAKTALEIKQMTPQFARSGIWNHTKTHPFKATVVLSSGAGLKGLVGDGAGSQQGFTILGEPINLAFRLEELIGKLGQDLIIPQYTADLIEDGFELEKIIKVKLRGEEEKIQILSIEGPKA